MTIQCVTFSESLQLLWLNKCNRNPYAIISGNNIFLRLRFAFDLYLACAIHCNHFQTLGNAHISSTDFVNERDKVFKVKLQINFHFQCYLHIPCMRSAYSIVHLKTVNIMLLNWTRIPDTVNPYDNKVRETTATADSSM